MDKVRLVTRIKEKERLTSFGKIEFDSEGVSIQELDRDIAETLTSVSQVLYIQGEGNKKQRPAEEIHEVEQELAVKTTGFTREEMDAELVSQGNRLVTEISKSLGLDESFVNEQLMSPLYPEEENKLIPVSMYNELMSDKKTREKLHLDKVMPVTRTVEQAEDGTENVDTTETETEVETFTHTVSQEDLDNNEELVEEAVEVGDNIEIPKEPTEEEALLERRAGLETMKIEELRGLLKELEVPADSWSNLKGNEGKSEMIELILQQAKS